MTTVTEYPLFLPELWQDEFHAALAALAPSARSGWRASTDRLLDPPGDGVLLFNGEVYVSALVPDLLALQALTVRRRALIDALARDVAAGKVHRRDPKTGIIVFEHRPEGEVPR